MMNCLIEDLFIEFGEIGPCGIRGPLSGFHLGQLASTALASALNPHNVVTALFLEVEPNLRVETSN